mgnify:CR=1 FL=1
MAHRSTDTIGIYIAEEQELYRGILQNSFESDALYRFLGISPDGNKESLMKVLNSDKPDILIIGTRILNGHLCEKLEDIRTNHPHVGLVGLITAAGDDEIKMLRKIAQKCRSGICIYLKQSLDNLQQLRDMVRSVKQGHVVLDPAIAGTMLIEKTESSFIQQLTEREMEILNLLAQGYTNQAISNALYIDIRTVAHHLNNIYSKLKDDSELNQKHPRVSVARLYLETTGELMPVNLKNSASVFPS